MKTPTIRKSASRPFALLRAKDLMSPNPVSIRRDAGIREALELLTDRGFGAAPVIDQGGRPIGVVSRTDILIHERECVHHARVPDDNHSPYDWCDWDVFPERPLPEGFSIEVTDPTTVAEIMTPAIFTVPLEAPAREVVKRMRELKVHHLFVVDSDLALVGVISPLDVIRHLEE
jgi:CBS domain-containing protein